MTVELYDYNSPNFAKTVLFNGRECMIIKVDQEYPSLYPYSYTSAFGYSQNDRYMRFPDVTLNLTLRVLPPPPPPPPKRTWTNAMGLRRPGR